MKQLACLTLSTLALLGCAAQLSAQLPMGDPKDNVLITGTVVDKKGAPVAGKSLCFLTESDGRFVALMDITSDGRLDVLTTKTSAAGRFSKRVPPFEVLKVALCTVKDLDVKDIKVLATTDTTKGKVALGKLTAE